MLMVFALGYRERRLSSKRVTIEPRKILRDGCGIYMHHWGKGDREFFCISIRS